jgi:hypothetical protein
MIFSDKSMNLLIASQMFHNILISFSKDAQELAKKQSLTCKERNDAWSIKSFIA